MSADGPEQREAERLGRDTYDHDTAAANADLAREILDECYPTRQLSTDLDKLGATALRIKRERDNLAAALRDLVLGADMCIPYFDGAAQGYMREVKRVASAALEECGP
jgi:hypothetical protein